ncbi:phosphoesterase PA-phosphatase related protein [Allomeiothermus silvanus DSM 9946]|uniref:Phosphoesterase PA-phosphatase related protein n=1 Tax=Allomeiothermus silvanus (strain ATCC 700542 / DSM 9946 / NBRC 106475 / NCIMB 13440 / VI-R2) TaxID=526227 RepID=D7BEB6_ALLS1|nr:phosphatase PAP2 family protein [Allomeiothermus silvanus]ADH64974.1 phosphoesterase PA-phosphatase related protein [Allomeiothermus silvanus DSM 9946]
MTRSFYRTFKSLLLLVPLWLLALLFLSLLGFVGLAEDVYEREGFFFDGPVLAFLHAQQSNVWNTLALAFTQSASAPVVGGLALGVLAWAYFRRLGWPIFALSLGGAAVLNQASKLFFARARPHLFPQLTPEHDYSFPSGHTMASLALVLALYTLLAPRFPRAARWVLALGLPWALLVGLSRLYLQVHYPSDVLAGWALSVLWVIGVGLWYCWAASERG